MNDHDVSQSRPDNPIQESEEDLCRALWLAVAIQAIIDASSNSRKKSAIKERNEALCWLSDQACEESDLALVCDLAGIDFRSFRKKFKEVLQDPAMTIDFRCLKKAGVDNRGVESRRRYFARMRKNARLKKERGLHNLGGSSVTLFTAPCYDQSSGELDPLQQVA